MLRYCRINNLIGLINDRIDMEAGKVFFLGRDIHFPRGYRPRTDSSCWFTPGVLCWGGEEHMMIFGGPSCCGCFSLLLRLLMVTKDSRTLGLCILYIYKYVRPVFPPLLCLLQGWICLLQGWICSQPSACSSERRPPLFS